jgi:hypothetical protein
MFALTDRNLTFRRAKELGISRLAASRMRRRYLLPVLGALILDGSPVALFWSREVMEELAYLERNERFEPLLPAYQNSITDEMIEQARNIPVTEVVQFNRFGKAHAWCHQDRNPSLTYMTRTGLAWCAACGKYHDAIGVLMTRDNLSFHEAIRTLIA